MESRSDNVISKAVTVLKALRGTEDGGSARELASTTGLPRSTVQRLLTSLTETGMVIQHPGDQRYRIGPQALLIGLGYRHGLSLVNLAGRHMLRVRDATGETVGLSVVMGDARVFVDEVQGLAPLRFASELGRLYPLWSGASGRVLMSDLEPAEVERILAERSLSEALFSPLSAAEARKRLEQARHDGYALAVSETIADVSSVAVPVWDARRRVAAALSISGPTGRLSTARLEEIRPLLQAEAAQLSSALGAENVDPRPLA